MCTRVLQQLERRHVFGTKFVFTCRMSDQSGQNKVQEVQLAFRYYLRLVLVYMKFIVLFIGTVCRVIEFIIHIVHIHHTYESLQPSHVIFAINCLFKLYISRPASGTYYFCNKLFI